MSEVVAQGIAKEQPLREDIQPGVSPGRRIGGDIQPGGSPGRRQGGNNGPSRPSSVSSVASGSTQQQGGFRLQPHQVRHQKRQDRQNQNRPGQQPKPTGGQQMQQSHVRDARRPVVGESDNAEGLRAAPLPGRDFFVYRVHKDDGDTELSEYIKKKGVDVRALTKTNHHEAKFNSFKLAVSMEDAAKVTDPQFWPRGIHIRRWRSDQQQRNQSQGDTANGPYDGHSVTMHN